MLQQLISDLRGEGGFELFHWAGFRQDITDYSPGIVDCCGVPVDTYIRAVHNLRNPAKLVDSKFDPYVTLVAGKGVRGKYDSPRTELIAYGIFRRWHEATSEVRVRRKGVWGLLGLEKVESRTADVLLTVLLEEMIEETSHPKSETWFLALTLNAIVPDSAGRAGTRPRLTIISHKDLVQESLDYLKSHPEDYLTFVRTLLPREEFPKVNAGILDETGPPKRIFAVNTETGQLNYSGSRYGENVVWEYGGKTLDREDGGGAVWNFDGDKWKGVVEVLMDKTRN